MLIEITAELLKPYFTKQKTHKVYKDTVKIYNDLRIHADGEDAGDLIKERRPSESENIQKYRQKIFVAITEGTVGKIVTSLGKIRRSTDWSVKFDKDKVSNLITKGETLEDYTESNYPQFESITKWVFDVLLKSYLVDPNGIVLTMIDNPVAGSNEYTKPYSVIFHSDQVYEFIENQLAILYSTDKSEYSLADGTKMYDGDVFYVCNEKVLQRWKQINAAKDIALDYEIIHNQGKLPAFKMKGLFHKSKDNTYIYKSRIAAIVPRLNEAVREYSDLQAEVVQHVHSEKWQYQTQKCKPCNNTGQLIVGGQTIKCRDCEGSGWLANSPYTNIMIPMPEVGQQASVGLPPAGYIQKQVEIVKIQDERIDKHIYSALSAINMEFLAQTPIAQSGTAKNVDRDELNTFVYSIAEDLVSIMDKVYAMDCNYRYFVVLNGNKDLLKDQLPKIPVPNFFDLLSSEYLLSELTAMRTAKLNPMSIVAAEIEYANKKFNNDPVVRDEVKAILELDPFPGLTEDEKLIRLQNDGIIRNDYVLSCNIFYYVKRAIVENIGFLKLDLGKKREFIQKYIDETLIFNSQAQQIINGVKIANGATDLTGIAKGITSMIEIATAVADGVLSLDGAIALASEKFGITTDLAKLQLKNIVIKPKPDPALPPVIPPGGIPVPTPK